MGTDQKMLGSGAPLPWKWFEVESVSDPAKNETSITAKLSTSNGATAIPLVHRVPKGVISGSDLLEAMKFNPGAVVKFVAAALQLPSRIRITGGPVPDTKDQARLTVECTHAGKRYDWHKDIEFDRVRVADMADMLKFLVLLQAGQAIPSA